MTNGDRIRNLSDEYLAKKVPCPHHQCQHQNDLHSCVDCCYDWLKEEEKDAGTDSL